MTTLQLSRKSEFLNRTRAIKIWMDGVEVGKIKNGSAETIDVAPGTHTICCKIDWCSSQDYTFELQENETAYLQVKGGMKYFMPFYIVLIGWLVANFIFKDLKESVGDAYLYLQLCILLIPVLYLLYYLTIGRKKYLVITKDVDNIFAK